MGGGTLLLKYKVLLAGLLVLFLGIRADALDRPAPGRRAVPAESCSFGRPEFRIGTNLLYDLATVPNLHFETGLAGRFAVNVSAAFSPWDIKPTLKLRTLLVQPEVRYYLSEDFNGHYFGVEVHLGWYDVALDGNTRYQDRDGDTPLLGAGVSYGYVVPLSGRWGMDFHVSAGYTRLDYDCFYNVKDGAWFTRDRRGYWGPTSAGISVFYKF